MSEQVPPALPTARELVDAMYGVVPVGHPATVILRDACLLAAVEEWTHSHRVEIAPGAKRGSRITRAADTLRRYLVDGVTDAAGGDDGVGAAVGRLAEAWVEWRCATNDDPERQAATRKALLAACDTYDQLAGYEI